MKKYMTIFILTLAVSLTTFLTSCGGTDASTNNGSDTGVNGNNGGVAGDVGRAIDDTMDDFGNENVDEYQGNRIDNWDDNSPANNDNSNNADMSFDRNGVMEGSTLNF